MPGEGHNIQLHPVACRQDRSLLNVRERSQLLNGSGPLSLKSRTICLSCQHRCLRRQECRKFTNSRTLTASRHISIACQTIRC